MAMAKAMTTFSRWRVMMKGSQYEIVKSFLEFQKKNYLLHCHGYWHKTKYVEIFELHVVLETSEPFTREVLNNHFETAILFEPLFNNKEYHLCQLFLQTRCRNPHPFILGRQQHALTHQRISDLKKEVEKEHDEKSASCLSTFEFPTCIATCLMKMKKIKNGGTDLVFKQ